MNPKSPYGKRLYRIYQSTDKPNKTLCDKIGQVEATSIRAVKEKIERNEVEGLREGAQIVITKASVMTTDGPSVWTFTLKAAPTVQWELVG